MIIPSDNVSELKLDNHDIHLWITKPQNMRQADILARYKSILNEEELKKQNSYIFAEKRHNALITRAFVRDLLSHYMAIHPSHWQFKAGSHGKPEIVNPLLPLRFNLSHTDDLIICAVTLNDDIGCDVEIVYRNCGFLSIAESYFSQEEFLDLLDTPENDQRNRFFDYWTLKESYIKTCGSGLSIPLTDFSFQIGSSRMQHKNDNIQLSFSAKRFDSAQFWRNWLFYPNEKHRIAVSIRGKYNNQTRQSRFRYFENTPLLETTELSDLSFHS